MTAFNVVATRARNGSRSDLLAWYADHIDQLLGTGPLKRVRLYGPAAGATPGVARPGRPWDCMALYEFESLAEFDSFEATPAFHRVQAELKGEIVLDGPSTAHGAWARNGIEIVFRAQYERRYQMRTAHAPSSSAGAAVASIDHHDGPVDEAWARRQCAAWYGEVDRGRSNGFELLVRARPNAAAPAAISIHQGFVQANAPLTLLGQWRR